MIVLVEPRTPGNIGAVARAMKNFGLEEMRLVNPCKITEEAWARAMHAQDILESAKTYTKLNDALKDVDFVAGTSAITTPSEKEYLRLSLTPQEFAEKAKAVDGRIALLFGREDFGLYNEELMLCDFLIRIPTVGYLSLIHI